jgi:ion channel-forming bestrophin family protein
MIVQRELTWLRMLFSYRGSALTKTLPRILTITAFSAVATAVVRYYGWQHYTLTVTPFTLIGLALAIFLGFRNNAAYDRFWEGRKLWGQLVNSSRSFAREVLTLVVPPANRQLNDAEVREFQEDLIRRMIAYVHAFRHHLRDSSPFDDLSGFIPEADFARLQQTKNVPIAILLDIGLRLRAAWRDGWISDFHFATIERTLSTITDVQGGCERIKNTPIPFAYTVLLHRTAAFYCLFLPFGIIDTVRWLTPLVVALISQAFLGLDEIGGEIEEPFGTEPQDLPLTSISRTIEVNLLQAIERKEVPELLEQAEGVLV